jgi:hypothetical protein
LTTTTTPTPAADLARIDQIATRCRGNLGAANFTAALELAATMRELRGLIAGPALDAVVSLQGTDLGFRTDKDKTGGYPAAIVRDVTIEAILRGFKLVGNEFNIIAGRFYATRAGMARMIADFPGLTDLALTEGGIDMKAGGALVAMRADWKRHGQADSLAATIPVRVNEGMGADAIIGKAYSKIYRRIWTRLTGSNQYDEPPESEAAE